MIEVRYQVKNEFLLATISRHLASKSSQLFKRFMELDDAAHFIAPFDRDESQLAKFMDEDGFEELMACFLAWLYTGKIFGNCLQYVKLWCFGQIIGSPSIMNLALMDLSSRFKSPRMMDIPPADRYRFVLILLEHAWDQSNFTTENKEAVIMEVHWENKKLLKLPVDIYAHLSLCEPMFVGDGYLKKHLAGRQQLGLQLARAIGAREKVNKAPWHEDCIGEYLVNEDMSERRFESDCRWEAA